MALFGVNCFSNSLGMCVHFSVIMPQRDVWGEIGIKSEGADRYPVLYLLHGLSDDDTIWMRRTSIERYATEHGIAVVMPTTHRGWYTDSMLGNYYTYIGSELPKLVAQFFPTISTEREDTYVAGLSMGGYGALKFALSMPKKYRAAASLSGAVDIAELHRSKRLLDAGLFREDPKGTADDIFYLAEKTAPDEKRPDIFMWCGTEDSLLDENHRMRDTLTSLGYNLTYSESAGIHAWQYWDEQILNVIEWICDGRTKA